MTAMPALDRRSDFVSAVAVELADLAPDDRAELIEELDDHIAALLEDRPEVDLATELGTPRAYAAELRTAAGLVRDRPPRVSLRDRTRELLRDAAARVPARWQPWLAGLRPVWWVLRGYAVFAAACHAIGASWSRDGLGVLVPAPGGVWGIGVIGCVVAAAASVRIGSWPGRTPRQRWVLLGLNVLGVVGALVVAGGARYDEPQDAYDDTQYVQGCPTDLGNLYGYDAAGRPITGLRLFDQNGMPFDLSTLGCDTTGRFAPGTGGANVYPWPTADLGQGAEPTGPPTSLAPLPGATVPSTTPSAAGTPSSTRTP